MGFQHIFKQGVWFLPGIPTEKTTEWEILTRFINREVVLTRFANGEWGSYSKPWFFTSNEHRSGRSYQVFQGRVELLLDVKPDSGFLPWGFLLQWVLTTIKGVLFVVTAMFRFVRTDACTHTHTCTHRYTVNAIITPK